jgi:hypothetical protein
MILELFQDHHLETFEPGARDAAIMGDTTEWKRGAVVAVENGKTMGIAGLGGQPNGVPMAWLCLSDEIRERPMFLFRALKRGLDQLAAFYSFPAIEVLVSEDYAAGRIMATRLGFTEKERPGGMIRMVKSW